jgi:cytochrome c oxidase subunit 1
MFNFFYELIGKFLYYENSNIFLNFKNVWYDSSYFNNEGLPFQIKHLNEEISINNRYQRFANPVFKYDFKSGDYFPKLYKELYTHLFSTILDTTSALRTAPWFISTNFAEIFGNNFNNFFENISKTNNIGSHPIHNWDSSHTKNTDAFYNFFYILGNENIFTNKRWVSIDTLNQKFHRMFFGSSMQQRVYSNWRQLKFTREAWRCKLLSARHQKTLFKRYVHEDGVFWSIERNARDLLPGWAMITPFSSRVRYTAIGKTDIGLLAVFLVLNSSIISSANFLVTYRYLSTLNNRKMRDSRSFFTEGVMCVSWMMLAANPMLAIGILMLLSDRHWQTSFFDYSGGGDTVLFQHMFWFFGHPEVYIVIIPCFGFTNTIVSYFLRKRVSARASLLYSMYTIAFLGFFVWGHHMYMVGLAHTTRMLFSTLTVMISVPAATKIMHWCVTIANSAFHLELPLLCILTFVFLFVSGGISGMCVAHTGMDVLFHDTFYVIGHFHIMFAGAAMFGCFAAFYFYFPAIFGVKYSRIFAYLHYVYYLVGHLMTFIPMFWLGYAGMPRRILDYPSAFGGWHSVISAGHMLSVAGMIAFFIMIFDSLRQAKAATRNTFGVSRYNTRLGFYLYENSRLVHVQRKSWYLYRFLRPSSIKVNGNNYTNLEYLETTLFSYTFTKK